MEIKRRAFPYPVLAPDSDDFTEGAVCLANPEASAAPERYTIRFRFDITHPDLLAMVENGDAAAAVVVECRQNLYRRRHAVAVGTNDLQISADELRGNVQVTPVVSAARELSNYRPRNLNNDYEGITIEVPRHGLLAYGANLEFVADPIADRLRRISSIMRVLPKPEAGSALEVNLDGQRIHVEVSIELFQHYQHLAESRQGSAVIASMLVFPVLIEVFHRIKSGVQDEFESYRWFVVVRARLRELGQDPADPNFQPMRAAQALLDSPFARGVAELITRLDLEGAS